MLKEDHDHGSESDSDTEPDPGPAPAPVTDAKDQFENKQRTGKIHTSQYNHSGNILYRVFLFCFIGY